MKRAGWILGTLLGLVVLAGCGSVLSKDALYGINYEVDYLRLRESPETHVGKTVIVGGRILDNRLDESGTTLEILRYTLNQRDEPRSADEASGRFLARTPVLLDPGIYQEGRLVTLAATLQGVEERLLHNRTYRYPLFSIEELYLVPERRVEGPGYDPYRYAPWPYWHRYPYWYRHPYWW